MTSPSGNCLYEGTKMSRRDEEFHQTLNPEGSVFPHDSWQQWNFSNGNDYGNNWPDVNGNGNNGNFKNGNIIKTEMKTFKTYRNGNIRDENEMKRKWYAIADLQCRRIVASLNLYFRCISVGKMRQCDNASTVPLYRQTCKMRLYPPHSRPPPKNRRPRATG